MDTRTEGHTDDRSPERIAYDDAIKRAERAHADWLDADNAAAAAIAARDNASHVSDRANAAAVRAAAALRA